MKMYYDAPKLKNLEKEYKYLDHHSVMIGFIGEEIQEDGEIRVYEYAFRLNEGTSFMPPRPFFDDAVETAKAIKEINIEQKLILDHIFEGVTTAKQGLNQLGVFIAQRIKRAILSDDYAELQDSTIEKKERNKQHVLREHDLMLKSVSYEIIKR